MSVEHSLGADGTGQEQPGDEQSAWEQMYADATAAQANLGGIPEQVVPPSETIHNPVAKALGPPAVTAASEVEQPVFEPSQLEPSPPQGTLEKLKALFKDRRAKIGTAIGGVALGVGVVLGISHGNNHDTVSPPAATAEQTPGGNNLTTAVSTTTSEALNIHPNTAPTTLRGVVADPGNLAPDLQISELTGTVVPWNGKQITLLPMLAKETYYGPNQEATYTANTMGNAVLQRTAYLLSANPTTPEYQQVLEQFTPSPEVKTYITNANTTWRRENSGADAAFFDSSESPVNFIEQIQGVTPVVDAANGTLWLRAISPSLERTFGDSANNSKFDAAPVNFDFTYDTTTRSDGYTGIVITKLAITPDVKARINAANTSWFANIYFNAGNIPQF
jgi:hypothetical protein